MEQAFDDIQKMFTAGALRIAFSLLYLVVPFVIVMILGRLIGARGLFLQFIGFLGAAAGLYVFVLYGLPTVTG